MASLADPKERKKVAESTIDSEILIALSGDTSVVVRRVVAARVSCNETLRSLVVDADLETSSNALENLLGRQKDGVVEDVLGKTALESAFEYINHHTNEDSDEFFIAMELRPKARAEFNRARLVAKYTNSELIQNRILHRLEDYPDPFSIRGAFLSALVDNPNLTRPAIRKLVLELGYGVSSVLETCKDPGLLDELIADDRLDQRPREAAMSVREKLLETQ